MCLILVDTHRYLNLEQAAVYLNTTKDGVRGMARAKLFPIKKAGTRTFIDIHDIDEAMQSNTAWAALEETVECYTHDKPMLFPEPILYDDRAPDPEPES